MIQLLIGYFWLLEKSVLEILIVVESLYWILKIYFRCHSTLFSWNKVVRGRNFTPFGEVEPYSEFAVCLIQTLATRQLAMIPLLFGLPTGSSVYLISYLEEERGKETASKYNTEVNVIYKWGCCYKQPLSFVKYKIILLLIIMVEIFFSILL